MKNPSRYFYMNAAELMDFSFGIYKKSFLHQFVMAVIGSILGMVISGLLLFILILAGIGTALPTFINNDLLMNFLAEIPEETLTQLALGFAAIIVFIFIILFTMASPLMLSGNFFITRQAFYNEPLDIGSAFSLAVRSIFRFITVVFAKLIVLVPIILIGAFLLRALLSTNAALKTWLYIAIALIILIFIFILLIADTFFCLANTVAFFEKKYFFSAIVRSIALVKRDFWKIMGLNLSWYLVLQIAYYSTVGIIDLLFTLSSFASSAVSIEFSRVLVGATTFRYIILAAASLFLMPLEVCIFNSLIYFNQRIKLEGLDIEIGIENLRRDLEITR